MMNKPLCECHDSVHCPDIDWEAQARLEANPERMALLRQALSGPTVKRPRRRPVPPDRL
jgi:hypothetical protein